jgi:ribosome-binding protein aMBF1 (putative translation factor)
MANDGTTNHDYRTLSDVEGAGDFADDVRVFLASVGDRIRKLREFRGMSRAELGEAIGLSGASANNGIYALENNGAATRADTIYKVARVLGVSPGFLLDGGEIKVEQKKAF